MRVLKNTRLEKRRLGLEKRRLNREGWRDLTFFTGAHIISSWQRGQAGVIWEMSVKNGYSNVEARFIIGFCINNAIYWYPKEVPVCDQKEMPA